MLDAITARLDEGGDDRPGTLSLYDGNMPDDPATPPGQSKLLAKLPFSYPAFHAASRGIAEAYSIDQRNAIGTGKVTWARFSDGAGNVVLDGDVGTEDEFVVLNTANTFQGGPVIIKTIRLWVDE